MKRTFAKLCAAAAAVVTLASAGPADAALIVPNFSFEIPNVGDGDFTDSVTMTTPITDWVYFGGDNGVISGGVWDPQNIDYTGADGDNAALPGTALGGQAGYIYLEQNNDQDPMALGAMFTTANSIGVVENNFRYTLTISLGNAKTFDPGEVTIALLVNDDAVASTTVEPGTLAEDTFTDVSAEFETEANDILAGGQIKVRITHTHGGTGVREVEFDNVRVATLQIPEPGSALALLAVGAMFARRSRRLA